MQKRKQELDFLVIGAQKSGTTSLFKYMREHPSLYLPPQKEINFFANEDRFRKGKNWYIQTYFSGVSENKLWGEVSPQYMGYKRAAAHICETFPKVQLIAILRNPIYRAYSHYRMAVRREIETRPFCKVIEDQRRVHPRLLETEVGNDWPQGVLSFGLYGAALKNYLRHFAKEQILILFQEDLLNKPNQTISRLFCFVGVDNVYTPPNLDMRYHAAGVRRFPALEDLVDQLYNWALQQNALKKAIRKVRVSGKTIEAARFWFEQLNIRTVEDEGPSPAEKELLRELFEDDVALLQRLFSVDPPWTEFGETQASRTRAATKDQNEDS